MSAVPVRRIMALATGRMEASRVKLDCVGIKPARLGSSSFVDIATVRRERYSAFESPSLLISCCVLTLDSVRPRLHLRNAAASGQLRPRSGITSNSPEDFIVVVGLGFAHR
jgi:hypothetical protein